MFDTHVLDQLAAYLDGELSSASRQRVEVHLNECAGCRGELEQVRVGRVAMQLLPLVPAPEGLWRAIESAAPDFPIQRRARLPQVWQWAAAALLILAAGTVLWRALRPPSSVWQVAALSGTPTAGTQRISGTSAIPTGQWVATDSQARARIAIGAIGHVQVEPNTSVRLVDAGPKVHRLALRNGEILASISAPPRLFFVDTPAGTAIDLGCEYSLRCDRSGTGMLRVTAGWVAMEWNGRETLVPAGASCHLYAGRGPGIPWFNDAAPAFSTAVDTFDHDGLQALTAILAEARARDTLTLWHLLTLVDGQNRALVYDRMAQLAPPPTSVTRDQVLQLNPQALTRWREELAWIW